MKYCFLLPAYKTLFFEDALGSILGQTYTDFNVIVSDDCSPEDLKSTVEKFNDSRVSYRRNERNIGAERLVDHWNMLLEVTDAEYVIMASDDDVYDAGYLEEMNRMISAHPEIDVFRPKLRLIDNEGKEFWREKVMLDDEIVSRRKLASLIATEKFLSGIPQFVFKRKALINLGGFIYFPYAWCSDDATVAALSPNGLAVSYKTLFSFRFSGISISTRKNLTETEWSGKLYAMADYVQRASEYYNTNEDDKVLLSQMYHKARKNTIVMLNDATFGTFFRMMQYIRRLKTPLFPFSWRVKRYAGRIYHKNIEILFKERDNKYE